MALINSADRLVIIFLIKFIFALILPVFRCQYDDKIMFKEKKRKKKWQSAFIVMAWVMSNRCGMVKLLFSELDQKISSYCSNKKQPTHGL